MTTPYAVLAPIYDRIGLSAYAEAITPRLLLMAQSSLDWIGRRVIDLGSGTGVSARFLALRGLNVTAIDTVPEMLREARDRTNSEMSGLRWIAADARALTGVLPPGETVDLIIGLGIASEIGGLREMEALFLAASHALDEDKMFIFDLETIEGLAGQTNTRLLYEDSDLVVFSQPEFDYERQTNTERMHIFEAVQMSAATSAKIWRRAEVERLRRAYPIQAVAALVTRCGFAIVSIMSSEDADLRPYDAADRAARVVFFCRKQGVQV